MDKRSSIDHKNYIAAIGHMYGWAGYRMDPNKMNPSMECQSEQSHPATSSSHDTNSVWMYGNYGTASGSHGQTYGDRDEARPRHNLIDLTKKNHPVFCMGYNPYMAYNPAQLALDRYNAKRARLHNPARHVAPNKDYLKEVEPVESGLGFNLLKKMGWKPGTGIGKNKDGSLEPLLLTIKRNRQGVAANDEYIPKKKKRKSSGGIANQQARQHVRDPVLKIKGQTTVNIVENLCRAKNWELPVFTCDEFGPPHEKRFMWTAILNNVAYKPMISSNNKAAGKSQACYTILQGLGIIDKYSWNLDV